jgi:hypothetical protein
MCENRSEELKEYTCTCKFGLKSLESLKEIKQLNGQKICYYGFPFYLEQIFWLNIMAQKAGLAPNCWFRIPAIY